MKRGEAFDTFARAAQERVLVLDGAMGTMIAERKLDEAVFRGDRFRNHSTQLHWNMDVLVLTQPEIVSGIHDAYLEAGADVIETNTFNATSASQASFGLESVCYEMNRAGAALARSAADKWSARSPAKPRFVAGAMGPTIYNLGARSFGSDSDAVAFDDLVSAYAEQARGLLDGGADLLLLETVVDGQTAKAALRAMQQVFAETDVELPVMISVAVTNDEGRLLSGETVEAFFSSVRHANPITLGFNCSPSRRALRPYLERLGRGSQTLVSAYPSAGLPSAAGTYGETPERFGSVIGEWAREGLVNLVGGCCGTTPSHIRRVAEFVKTCEPRSFRDADGNPPVAKLELS